MLAMDPAGNSPENSPAKPSQGERLRPYQFTPGTSGNPKGRPRKSLLDREIDKLLKSRCEEDPMHRRFAALIARSLVAAAIKGGVAGVAAAHLVAERSGGKVPAQSEFEPITEIRVHIHKNVPLQLADEPAPPRIEGK
jgi:uncharacterized protein DUF5681